nr:deleted in malignant brain tumors 1 protein-like [Chelonoidis abingdonii]
MAPRDWGARNTALLVLLGWLGGLTISEHTQLRLVNGPSRCAGRVEVLHDQQWGAVCDRSWDTNDAKVVCRQLACGAVLSVPDKAWFGEGSDPIWLDEINCTGTEASLTECRARLWGDHNCTHEEDAGVVCSEQSQLRLVNSQSRCTGRLEVLHNQQWGTVCDHSWDLRDAEVVCRQLSCGTALLAPGRAQFGEGSDPIWLNDVHCTGTEEAITECRAKPWGVHNCTHGETAGVVCSGLSISEPAQLQLVNGPHRCTGRVEVFLSQQWGTVCDDDWDFLDARVVCKQLGCGMASLAPHEAHFGRGSHLIWLDHVNCSGTEAALSECRARPWGVHDCNHREDASVVCSGPAMSLGVWLLRSALVLLLLGSAPIITCILEKGAPILPEPLRTGNGNKGQPGEDPAMGEESVIYANVPSLLAPRDLSERCTDGEDTSNTGLRGSLAWNREMAASAPSVQTFHPPCLLH